MNYIFIFDWIIIYYLIFVLLGLRGQIKNKQPFSRILTAMACDTPIFGRILNWW